MTEQDSSDSQFRAEFDNLSARAKALGPTSPEEAEEPDAVTDGVTDAGLPKRAPRKNLPFKLT